MPSPVPSTPTPLPANAVQRHDYDIDDDAADLDRWPQLRGVLTAMRSTLLPVYQQADAAAMQQQAHHAWLVRWAAIFGSVAVLCAIFELAVAELAVEVQTLRHGISVFEILTALVALLLVSRGLWSALHPNWLVKRFVAEQCRFVKFHLLLNPAVWHQKSAAEIQTVIEAILSPLREAEQQPADRRKHLIEEWVKWKRSIVGRFQPVPVSLPDELTKELTAYCQDKRLHEQRRYFDRQARKRRVLEERTRYIPPLCFFLSILAAFLHFVLEWFAGEQEHGHAPTGVHTAAIWCIVGAVAFPVIAAGVRTFRSAHEFGRNQLRFAAMSHFLGTVVNEVNGQPATVVFPLLREAEHALEAEHRAWLRLMIEAEWFG